MHRLGVFQQPVKHLVSPPPSLSPVDVERITDKALSDVRQREGLLTSLYRSLVDDSARQTSAREAAAVLRQQMMASHQEALNRHATSQRELEAKISQLHSALRGVEDAAAQDVNAYIASALLPSSSKSKEVRLLRAHQLGLINSVHEQLMRPEETAYDLIKRTVRQEDKNQCMCCCRSGLNGELHVHHVIPLFKFGTNNKQNLVTLCHSCHNKQHPGFQVTRNQPIRRAPRKQGFVAVDIETTGFSNEDSIIEIGAALFVNGELSDVFSSLVYTKRQLPAAVIRITGITSELIQSAPKADVVFEEFRKFIGDSRLVFHHAAFDMRFLNRYAEYFNHPFKNPVHDTLTIARQKLPHLPNHKLATLAEHFELKVHPTHRAKDDSIATGGLYLHLSRIKAPARRTTQRSARTRSKAQIAGLTHEQEQKLLPVLTRVLDAAFRLGYVRFKDAAKFSLNEIRNSLGDDAADSITLDLLQGAYIGMAGGKSGADDKRAVIAVKSKDEIEAVELKKQVENPTGHSENTGGLTPDAESRSAPHMIANEPTKTSRHIWLPTSSSLSREQALALSVPARAKPTQSLYLELLARKLQALIDGEPKEAWLVIEYVPSLRDDEQKYWGLALTNSDSMMLLLNQIDWSQPGEVRSDKPQSLLALLEQIP